ncbi:MAG: DegT/DnrJ/EryC1/StrS family aminotransferase [Candidatus Cloacimonetes bacterium]|nr:DegT/DnrJ/EryC1/StrS family aminotransferase [Candidatus Cloacimonadota bacterium]
MRIPFNDLKAQYNSIHHEVDAAMNDVIEHTAFVGGKALARFEEAFADYIGSEFALGVGNGTDAISIALRGLDIGVGDEVITAANSFVASSEAITTAGATPVFVDCHPDTYTIDVSLLEAAITPRTRAIMPVHLYGQPTDMDAVLEIAMKHGLLVIEDSAQAHGAKYKGIPCGSMGVAATFSFYPGKNLGAYGDGGAIVTSDKELADWCRMYANHGRVGKYDHKFEGVNSRLDGLQSAVLDVKLGHLNAWNARRRDIAALYSELLAGVDEVVTPHVPDYAQPVFHLYVIRTSRRDELRAALDADGIASGIHYPIGLPYLKAYAHLNHKPQDFPVTWDYQDKLLSLPIYAEMTDDMVRRVAERIKAFHARG